jgi:PAS domain S-box-containing protein
MKFQKSNNIEKLRELVQTLTIRDIEVFESRDLLEMILENTTDGYWDWHVEKDYEYLSPTFKKQLGYNDDELENHPSSWMTLIFDEDLKVMQQELEKHFKSKGDYEFKTISRYKHKNGGTIKILCRGKVVSWGENDKPIRMVGTHIDITNL